MATDQVPAFGVDHARNDKMPSVVGGHVPKRGTMGDGETAMVEDGWGDGPTKKHCGERKDLIVVSGTKEIYMIHSSEAPSALHGTVLIAECSPKPTFLPPLQSVIDAHPVRCMVSKDVAAYLQHESQERGPAFQLEGTGPFHPHTFASFTTTWWDLWRGADPRSADERFIVSHFVTFKRTCPIQMMQPDHALVTTMLQEFGAPQAEIILLNLYIRALGCRMESIHAFGKWVDASNQAEFAAFLAAFHDGPVFEPGRQVAGFEQLKANIRDATKEGYAALAFVLQASTGEELKRRMLQLKGLRSVPIVLTSCSACFP